MFLFLTFLLDSISNDFIARTDIGILINFLIYSFFWNFVLFLFHFLLLHILMLLLLLLLLLLHIHHLHSNNIFPGLYLLFLLLSLIL